MRLVHGLASTEGRVEYDVLRQDFNGAARMLEKGLQDWFAQQRKRSTARNCDDREV